ncbi:hypothetical protein [Streptomyces qinglanensis]|uniref:hypothetical protein n=1 Tax=Streptomyces qinglanensis TaxID=943816 RepID=UPI003D73FC2E
MPIPEPFTTDGLMANMEAMRGRQIVTRILPENLANRTGFRGLCIRHQKAPLDLILHSEGSSRWHHQQILLHELVHLWADDALGVPGLAGLAQDGSADYLQDLVRDGRIAARKCFDTKIEKRTEDAATLLNRLSIEPHVPDVVARRTLHDFTYGRTRTRDVFDA